MSPYKAMSYCGRPGCKCRSIGHGLCAEHEAQRQAMVDASRPTPTVRGYGREWQRTRLEYLGSNPVCAVCGDTATDVDHVIPKRDGGTDDWDNLESLCHPCHSRKTARQDRGFGNRGYAKAGVHYG